jgi:hypothetical protein
MSRINQFNKMTEKKKLELLWRYYAASIVVYLIVALVIIKFMSPASFQISANYLTSNPLLSYFSTSFTSASHVIWNIQFRWALVTLMGLSIIAPAIGVYIIKNNFKKIDLNKYRLTDWVVSSSLVMVIIALLSGISDLVTLVLIVCLNLLAYSFFWLMLSDIDPNKSLKEIIYKISIVAKIVLWLVIAYYAINTWVYGEIRSPWYVYITYVIGLLNLALIIYTSRTLKNKGINKKTFSSNIFPMIIHQSFIFSFVLILIIGLKR